MSVDPFPPNANILYNDSEGNQHKAIVLQDDEDMPSCPNANHRLIQFTEIENCQVVTHVDNLEIAQ